MEDQPGTARLAGTSLHSLHGSMSSSHVPPTFKVCPSEDSLPSLDLLLTPLPLSNIFGSVALLLTSVLLSVAFAVIMFALRDAQKEYGLT